MKLFLCFFIFSNILLAQEINQFDAEGKRHGEWLKRYDNTKILRYQGVFSHGKEVGVFKYYKNIKDKQVLVATKKFGKNDNIAEVKFFDPNGKVISKGKMDGKVYIGTWKYYHKNSDKLVILEHYDNSGNLEGERFVYYKNGQIAENQNYKNGKLNGVTKLYSEDNIILKHFVYANDELHGESKYYNSKGELIIKGSYKKGKKDGVWKYYENGKITEEKNFSLKPKYIKKNGKYTKAP